MIIQILSTFKLTMALGSCENIDPYCFCERFPESSQRKKSV